MAASDPARVAIETEQRIIRHREFYELTEMLAHHAQWAYFHATRSREEVEARHQHVTQALEEARRHEQSARQAFEEAEQACRWMFDELQRLEALLQSARAGHLP